MVITKWLTSQGTRRCASPQGKCLPVCCHLPFRTASPSARRMLKACKLTFHLLQGRTQASILYCIPIAHWQLSPELHTSRGCCSSKNGCCGIQWSLDSFSNPATGLLDIELALAITELRSPMLGPAAQHGAHDTTCEHKQSVIPQLVWELILPDAD